MKKIKENKLEAKDGKVDVKIDLLDGVKIIIGIPIDGDLVDWKGIMSKLNQKFKGSDIPLKDAKYKGSGMYKRFWNDVTDKKMKKLTFQGKKPIEIGQEMGIEPIKVSHRKYLLQTTGRWKK